MKKSKFTNKKCSLNGIKFDSMLEMEAYKKIKPVCDKLGLEVHVQKPFFLKCKTPTNKEMKYFADFVVSTNTNKNLMVIDMKSKKTITTIFTMKKSLFEALYNLKIHMCFSPEGAERLVSSLV